MKDSIELITSPASRGTLGSCFWNGTWSKTQNVYPASKLPLSFGRKIAMVVVEKGAAGIAMHYPHAINQRKKGRGSCIFYPTLSYHFLWQEFAAEVVVAEKGRWRIYLSSINLRPLLLRDAITTTSEALLSASDRRSLASSLGKTNSDNWFPILAPLSSFLSTGAC